MIGGCVRLILGPPLAQDRVNPIIRGGFVCGFTKQFAALADFKKAVYFFDLKTPVNIWHFYFPFFFALTALAIWKRSNQERCF
jgi:hypothetical protein